MRGLASAIEELSVPFATAILRPTAGEIMQEASKQPDYREKTNAAYQDAMKTILSLATASLVLPIVLVRTFADGDSPKSLFITRRAHMAYIAWLFLLLSISLCLVFFYASVKYLKIILLLKRRRF